MRDEQLLSLVRMAAEAREWEHQLSLPAEAPSRAPRGQGLGTLLGLAACVALAACLTLMVWLSPGPGPTPGPQPGPFSATDTVPKPPAARGEPSMVLALFQDPDTQCECFVWREASFGGRSMSDVRPSELLAAALRDSCAPQRQGTVFVVGLQGPREQLPPTREAARALALCMAGGTETCGEEASCYGAGAVGCVPSDVRVVAEAIRH